MHDKHKGHTKGHKMHRGEAMHLHSGGSHLGSPHHGPHKAPDHLKLTNISFAPPECYEEGEGCEHNESHK